ncbi:hypothetical protein L218DRAFT_865505 [Marasmius fiardii PR-910]|nr:hypothetical protein L218DRAFT_865505 [Marasmius fiardii PR-910]
MDLPLNPPIRIQPIEEHSVSSKTTEKLLDVFLDDFHARTSTAQGGNTTVSVQLQKLKDALAAENTGGFVFTIHDTVLY